MPHYCRICGRQRSNEKFSGRGHRDHICKDCQRLPREQRDCIERFDELHGFLDQSHISLKNIRRLEILSYHAHNDVCQLATLLLEVARITPYKRRRWKFLAQNHQNLFLRLNKLFRGYLPEDVVPDDVVDSLPDSDLADSDLPY
jgi:hypothetical protein